MESTSSPKFLGDPYSYLPCSQTPVGPPRQAVTTFKCCPRTDNGEDSHEYNSFEALLHGFYDRYLRFTAVVTHGRARLASSC